MMRMRIDEIQIKAVRNSNKRIKVRGSAETWGTMRMVKMTRV